MCGYYSQKLNLGAVMSVSGSEETGVKFVTRRSSLDISGVPIKKRRYFRPPSPPPEEESSFPSVNATQPNENENEESCGNVVQTERNDIHRVKIVESISEHASDSLAKLGAVEKLQTAVESRDANAGLAVNNIFAPNAGKEIKGQEIGDEKATLDIPMVSENASSLLGPSEHNVSALEADNTGRSNQIQKNVESVSLNLSLSVGEQDNKGKLEDIQLNAISCSEQANRSNWDLNTTMEAWEGASSDMAANQITTDDFNTVSCPVNVKPLCVGAGSNGGKLLFEEGSRSGLTGTFSESRFNDGDSLNLGLGPFLLLNSGEGTSGSFPTKNLNSVIPNNSLTGFAAGNVNVFNSSIVKSEPLDASLRHDFGDSLPNSMPLPITIKVEHFEKIFQESHKLPSSCAPNLDAISIKAEPLLEGNQQTLKNLEGASIQPYKSVLQGQGAEGKSVSPSEKQVLHVQGAIKEFACSKDQLKNFAMTSSSSKDKLSVNGNELIHAEHAKPGEVSEIALPIHSQVLAHHSNNSSIPPLTDNTISEHKNVDKFECHRKLTVDVLDSHGIVEGSVSDKVKINLCGDNLAEDGHTYECESDGNSIPMDIQEDNKLQNNEDGEVQEEQLGSAVGDKLENGEDTGGFDSVNENRMFLQLSEDENKSAAIFREEGTREDTVETGKDSAKEFDATHLCENTVEETGKPVSMRESMVVEILNRGANENEEIQGDLVQNLQNLEDTDGFDSVNEKRMFLQLSEDENKSAAIFREEGTREDTVETGKDSAKEFDATHLCQNTVEETGKHVSMQESMVVEILNRGANENEEIQGDLVQNLQNLEDTDGFDSVNENRMFLQLSEDENKSAAIFREEGSKEETVETGKDSANEFDSTHLYENTVEETGKHISMQESMVVEILNRGANENEEIQGQLVHNLQNLDDTKGEWTEQASDQVIGVGQQYVDTSPPGSAGNAIRNNEGMNDSTLPKEETCLNFDDKFKDASARGNRSRIINLSRASNASSLSKPLLSRSGRERLPDTLLERNHPHSRGRDDVHDVMWKFSRDRYQDHPYRNSRLNFSCGRGRVSNRIVSFREDRNSEGDYNSDYRNSFSEYGIPRNKYVLVEAEAEYDNYNVEPDANFTGAAWPGRKMLDGDSSVFHHQRSRKRSLGWRDGPTGYGHQMVRRTPRNTGEEGCEGGGLRHGEKFIGEFSDYGQSQPLTHSQTSYKGLDNQYVQGSRSLLSLQRRPRSYIRSKSPIRPRSHGLWSSKRRSPDVFGGHPELPHRRSPVYMERMRSPDHSVFPGEMLVRRDGSPQCLTRANDLSNMDIGRDPGNRRSAISDRSPNGRIFFRNSRRYGIVDPRERPDDSGLFGSDVHSVRFNELNENSEDRRRISDRPVPVHSFRPPFSDNDGENFHLNAEHRSRPFRFHVNTENPQFRESGSFRDREYDRRNKDRSGNVPRRPRGIEG